MPMPRPLPRLLLALAAAFAAAEAPVSGASSATESDDDLSSALFAEYDAFEARLDAARRRYDTSALPRVEPESGRRLQGSLRDTLLPPVRDRILAWAETNQARIQPISVFTVRGRSNDIWHAVSMAVWPEEPEPGNWVDAVFRLHSRTAIVFPEYGDDFETFTPKRLDFFSGEQRFGYPLEDWACLPKANITWCGVDFWEIEHPDFREGLLHPVPFDDLLRSGRPPSPDRTNIPPAPAPEALAAAVEAVSNRVAALDADALREEARQVSQHIPDRALLAAEHAILPLPDAWCAPFEAALAPVCDGRPDFGLYKLRRTGGGSDEEEIGYIAATLTVGEARIRVLFLPFDMTDAAPEFHRIAPGILVSPARFFLRAVPR